MRIVSHELGIQVSITKCRVEFSISKGRFSRYSNRGPCLDKLSLLGMSFLDLVMEVFGSRTVAEKDVVIGLTVFACGILALFTRLMTVLD